MSETTEPIEWKEQTVQDVLIEAKEPNEEIRIALQNRITQWIELEVQTKKPSKKRQNLSPRNTSLSSEAGYTKFFINIGSKHNLTKLKLIGMINDYSNNRKIDIGKIEILKPFSFFEIENKHRNTILNAFKNVKHEGQSLSVELSD